MRYLLFYILTYNLTLRYFHVTFHNELRCLTFHYPGIAGCLSGIMKANTNMRKTNVENMRKTTSEAANK
ncbi:hypothetical protein RJT34_31929 [Clitoria ternatea]|uniref:Uncharacterized protein n=1 Tax=Clitoria ternatea TaxID=43366 RepID=A0AAN9I399_CLITE